MDLNEFILPEKLVEAFKDVNPVDEVNKFLIDFDTASSLEHLPHLRNKELMTHIDISSDKILVGKISPFSHGEMDFKLTNPCNDYFLEYIFGPLFEAGFFKICGAHRTLEDSYSYQPSGQKLEKLKLSLVSSSMYIYRLFWNTFMSMNPVYFVMSKDELSRLLHNTFVMDIPEFSNYLAARISENLYASKLIDEQSSARILDFDKYVDHIIEVRHSKK